MKHNRTYEWATGRKEIPGVAFLISSLVALSNKPTILIVFLCFEFTNREPLLCTRVWFDLFGCCLWPLWLLSLWAGHEIVQLAISCFLIGGHWTWKYRAEIMSKRPGRVLLMVGDVFTFCYVNMINITKIDNVPQRNMHLGFSMLEYYCYWVTGVEWNASKKFIFRATSLLWKQILFDNLQNLVVVHSITNYFSHFFLFVTKKQHSTILTINALVWLYHLRETDLSL